MFVVVAVLIISGLTIQFFKRSLWLVFYLFLLFYVPFFLTLIFNLPIEDSKRISHYSLLFITIVFLVELLRNRFRFKNVLPIILFFLLFIYAAINTFLHNVDFNEYILHFFVSCMFPIFCCHYLVNWQMPDWRKLDSFILILFFVNLILSFLQYFGGLFTPQFKEETVMANYSSAYGLFSGENINAMYIMLFLLYILLRKTLSFRARLLIIILSFCAILFTGVRTYLVCFIIFVPLCFFMYKESQHTSFVKIVIIPIVLLPFLILSQLNSSGYNSADAENVFQRQLYGLSNLSRGESTTVENSTMFLSAYVFSEHFVDNPIFGSWKLYTNNSYDLVSIENKNNTDATIAVLLSDIGVVGFLLYLLFQVSIIFKGADRINRKYILMIYFYAIIITYTDQGIFGGAFVCSVYIISNLFRRNSGIFQFVRGTN